MDFSSRLLSWYDHHKRELPWRDTQNAYHIWLSEIILQQTRIAQGLDYYHRFLEQFPDVESLAAATEDQVLGLWQGLGYYSRARNLHHTAKVVAKQYGGVFPASYKGLLQLKGVGQYTAAAIASMAYNLPHASVDGNVIRVLARFLGIGNPVDSPATAKQIQEAANNLLDINRPGTFNQALMDLGALVCKPSKPLCGQCPFFADCTARLEGQENIIPIKKNKQKVRKRFFHFFLIYDERKEGSAFMVEKRTGKDIWKNLFQLPLIETQDEKLSTKDFEKNNLFHNLPDVIENKGFEGDVLHFSHILTHQRIEAFFRVIKLPSGFTMHFENSFQWVTFEQFITMGKPVLITKFLDKVLREL